MKVAAQLREEAKRLMGEEIELVRVDPEGKKGNLLLAGKEVMDRTIFKGADLSIDRYTFENEGEGVRAITQELWTFYPDHVLKTIRREREKSWTWERLAPKGLATEKVEADRDDLGVLLTDLKMSAPFEPRSI